MNIKKRYLWAVPVLLAALSAVLIPVLAKVSPSAAQNATMSSTFASSNPSPSTAYNGEPVTVTLFFTNVSAISLTNVQLIELLPQAALDNVQCLSACALSLSAPRTIPEPLGGTIVVSTVTGIQWSSVAPVNPGESFTVTYTARVVGQLAGSLLTFKHNATFLHGGVPDNASAPADKVTVQLFVTQAGVASLSPAPSWISQDAGGTISQDWGDYDRDGGMDLALGSSQGAAIYHNDSGTLTPLWTDGEAKRAYGVRWADVDNDGFLDLVVVGESVDHTPVTEGRNYIYNVSGSVVSQRAMFTSTRQLVRLALADLNGDGLVDLVASTNVINAGDSGFCGVVMFVNQGGTFGPETCLFQRATAAIAVADINNDGHPDLVFGQFPNQILVALNGGEPTVPSFSNTLVVERNVPFLAYDFAFGDYDGDGFLDIAAAYPLQREARVYHNISTAAGSVGFDGAKVIKTSTFLTPLSLDWGFFSGSGHLELAVADDRPKVYQYLNGKFSTIDQFTLPQIGGQQWSTRGVRLQRSTDVDITITNRDKASQRNSALTPRLATTMRPLDNAGSGSVAWGDRNGDGLQDILFGASSGVGTGAGQYMNGLTVFSARTDVGGGLGPQQVAFGDVNGDGKLDTLIANSSGSESVGLFLNGNNSGNANWSVSLRGGSHVAAFGDANGDGILDVMVGSAGDTLQLYLNSNGVLSSTAAWVSPVVSSVRSIAWMDYDKDGYQDFAVANYGVGAQVYHNNKDNTFTLVWTSTGCTNSTSVAWADVNGDGIMDLAVGCYGQATQIYANSMPTTVVMIATAPSWSSATMSKTTAVAFGDWDNDGWAELAVANDGESAQVFSNDTPRNAPGAMPSMNWIWSSAEKYAFTGAAWGDFNGDGFMDLALSAAVKSTQFSGIYTNTTVIPSHVGQSFAPLLPLPFNPPYVTVARPGNTPAAYLFSSSEQVLNSKSLTQSVDIHYRVYDANGTRNTAIQDATGITIANTTFEFSLDDGANWHAATPTGTGSIPITTTRLGRDGIFVWDAVADKAISYDARFRVTVNMDNLAGPVYSTQGSAVSPPFQIQATTCELPFGAGWSTLALANGQTTFQVNDVVNFVGSVTAKGTLTFTWDFGPGTVPQVTSGENIPHTFPANGIYTVTVSVIGEPCPITREAIFSNKIVIGSPTGNKRTYLPVIGRSTGGVQ